MHRPNFKIKISGVSAVVLALFIIFYPTVHTLFIILSVFLHESSHLLAMRLIGCKAQKLQITPLGMIIDYTHTFRSYEQDLWVFLAGPFANILLFCFFRNCSFWQLNLFSTINLSYAVLNLLPVYSLDGGCALEAILSLHLTSQAVEKTLFVSSFLVITALWIGSIWELFTFANGYSLFAFCVWLFISLFLK